jgi:hypothetical protein
MITDMDRQERLIRVLRRKQYIAEGHTEQEAAWLAKNASEKRFSDLPAKEQKKLTKEIDQVFATIPEEYRERAKELSGF